jgi:uncharacterized delta-60 repeat protein
MKLLRALLVVPVVLALMAGGGVAESAAAGPSLDTSFGQGGRLVGVEGLGFNWTSQPRRTVVAPDGDLYVAAELFHGVPDPGRVELRRYLPNGTLDPSFGAGGSAVVPNVPGIYFALTDMALDPQGRIVLIGTTVEEAEQPNGWRASAATAIRLTNAGALDPTYGSGGYASFDFGLAGQAPATKPTVKASTVAIDGEGRVLLVASQAGIWSDKPGSTYFQDRPMLVARLTAAGVLDPSFAAGGTLPLRSDQWIETLVPGADGSLEMWMRSPNAEGIQVERLRPDGTPDSSFGPHATRRFPNHHVPFTPANSTGGTALVLTYGGGPGGGRRHEPAQVERVDARGNRIKAFGQGGLASIALRGPAHLNGLAPDGRGGAYLVGVSTSRVAPRYLDGHPSHRFLVVHLLANGKVDRGFGTGGEMRIGFDTDAVAYRALLTPAGKLLVEGVARDPDDRIDSRQVFAQLSPYRNLDEHLRLNG